LVPIATEIIFFRRPGERRIGSALDREWRRTGYEDELWAQVETWEETGYLPPAWYHRERGTSFDGMGPPGSTVRLYYADFAGQIVLLHATSRRPGRGSCRSVRSEWSSRGSVSGASGSRMERTSMTRDVSSCGRRVEAKRDCAKV